MKKQEKTLKQPTPKLTRIQNPRQTVCRPSLFHRKGSRHS